MKHANEIEAEKERQDIIDQWKEANGIVDVKPSALAESDDSWSDVVKKLLLKPYAYVVVGLLAISPYGVEIVRMLIEAFGK